MSFRNMCKKDVKIISKLPWSGDSFNWMTQTVIKTKHGMNKNRAKKPSPCKFYSNGVDMDPLRKTIVLVSFFINFGQFSSINRKMYV